MIYDLTPNIPVVYVFILLSSPNNEIYQLLMACAPDRDKVDRVQPKKLTKFSNAVRDH